MSDMEPIGDIVKRTVGAFRSEQKSGETWECPECGSIPPIRLPSGRLIRGICNCERLRRKQAILREQRRIWMEAQFYDTYGWLGKDFTDFPLGDHIFESFDESRQQKAYNAARDYALAPEGSLILHGTWGTGKTHLLAAICNELRCREVASRFTSAPKLFQAMGQAIGHHDDHYILMRKAIMTPLLVIDDIDKANPSEWRNEQLYIIFNERAIHNRPIAISTNRLDELDRYIGGAARSRLSIGQIAVEMVGKDYRMEM